MKKTMMAAAVAILSGSTMANAETKALDAFMELYPVVQQLEEEVLQLKEEGMYPLYECGANLCRTRYGDETYVRSFVPEKFFTPVFGVNDTGLRWHFKAWHRAFYLAVGSCSDDKIYQVNMESFSLGQAYLPPLSEMKVYSKRDNPEKWDAIHWNWDCPDEINVQVDVKPGTDVNAVKLSSKGRLPVAILGSDSFDVESVDLATLNIDSVASAHAALEDVNGDGIMDIISHYSIPELVAAAALTAQTTTLTVKAVDIDGVTVTGSDSVSVK